MSPPPFQTLLDAHGPAVHAFLAVLAGRQEADDLYQETWLAALRAYPALRSSSNLRSWVFTIAHRKAIDSFRARARSPAPLAELPEAPAPAGAGDPELWANVSSLPAKQRAAVTLRYSLDLAYAEIGQVLDCSEAAARRSVHEGLKRLRKDYSDEPA